MAGNNNGTFLGRTVTLQMLLAANILKPEKSSMAIEYLGQKFMGDLLPDGKIKSVETETIFCSPSAWAIHCKRIINPDKKSGCGWASVKYKGKKLDYYKQSYLRKCQLQKECSPSDDEPDLADKKEMSPPPPIKRQILTHNTINNRHIIHDANSILEAVPFPQLGKLQPFLLNISSSALLLIDLHSHLTKTEVCGYLGGSWDANTHNLQITHSFPCRNSQIDRDKAGEVECNIKKAMAKQNLILVGWYHSHPRSPAHPTLRDIDAQLNYQIKMRGPTDATYSPCIGMICAPYNEENPTMDSAIIAYWVVPPPENKPQEYGRPMLMTYNMVQEKILSEHAKVEIKETLDYYKMATRMVKFGEVFREETTYIEKMKTSLYPKFAKINGHLEFWNFIRGSLGLDLEEEFIKPKNAEVQEEIKEGNQEFAKSDSPKDIPSLSQISSLQEQLNLPSGLNMNPIYFSTSGVTGTTATTTSAGGGLNIPSSSPRDSPITIPSNSASPAKFEVPIRASPSPAKSDSASSSRTRASPAPSPGKLMNLSTNPDLTIVRNSPGNVYASPASTPSVSSKGSKTGDKEGDFGPGHHSTSTLKYEGGSAAAAAQNMNELFAASLASLSKTLPPGLLSSADYATLFGAAPNPNSSSSSYGQSSQKGSNPSNDFYSMATGGSAQASGRSGDNSSSGSNATGSNKSSANNNSGTSSASAAIKEKFTIEQLLQSPVVPPHLKELLSQIDQNDLNFILSHPMFNNPAFLNALMPKQASSAASVNDPGPSTSRSNSSSARTSSANNKQNYPSSHNQPGPSKEIKGYYDTHQLPSSLAHSQNLQSVSSSKSSKGPSPSSLMSTYEEANKQLADLMKSPEYANFLLQQNAFGMGLDAALMSHFPPPAAAAPPPAPKKGGGGKGSKGGNMSNLLPPMPTIAELNTLLQATQKMPELGALFGAKPSDISALIQQQIQQMNQVATMAPSGSSRKSQQQQQQQDINALFGSKLPDLTTITPVSASQSNSGSSSSSNAAAAAAAAALTGMPSDFAALFGPMLGSGGSTSKKESFPNNDMLATLLQIGKAGDFSSLLFPPGSGPPTAKQLADLNAFFSHPQLGGSGSSSKVSGQDPMSLYPNISVSTLPGSSSSSSSSNSGNLSRKQQQQQQQQQQQLLQMQQEQELANLYQQHLKYPGIPDPLSKSTLAANNLYMSPSVALMKMQQEALNSMMMKPPKNTTSSSGSLLGNAMAMGSTGSGGQQGSGKSDIMSVPPSISPLSERLLLTPTKSTSSASSSRGNSPQVAPPLQNKNYNFSAADLAISSVSNRNTTPSPKSTTSSNYGGSVADLSRKSMSPANLSVFSEAPLLPQQQQPIKKRMEFSSIADLAAPPPAKVPKFDNVPSVSPAPSTGSIPGRDSMNDQDDPGVLNLSHCD